MTPSRSAARIAQLTWTSARRRGMRSRRRTLVLSEGRRRSVREEGRCCHESVSQERSGFEPLRSDSKTYPVCSRTCRKYDCIHRRLTTHIRIDPISGFVERGDLTVTDDMSSGEIFPKLIKILLTKNTSPCQHGEIVEFCSSRLSSSVKVFTFLRKISPPSLTSLPR